MEITLHPQLKRVLKMAASFALVILISGGSVMALSPTARAVVMGWLFGREADAYVYRSTGTDTDEDTITTYDLAEIPEDATLIPIQLGDIQADYYQSNIESSGSTIVWTDPENDYLVTVDGFFSLEELTDMALNLVKERVPVPEN